MVALEEEMLVIAWELCDVSISRFDTNTGHRISDHVFQKIRRFHLQLQATVMIEGDGETGATLQPRSATAILSKSEL